MTAATTAARFDQRLGGDFFEAVQNTVRERLDEDGLDALLTDDPQDVAYLTGFFHFPCERPVAVWVGADGRTVLLLPELEREHADSQHALAEIASYPEYPGVLPPYDALAQAVGPGRRRVGHATSTSYHRLSAARAALSDVEFVPTEIVTTCRYVKRPEEVALHAEAARITDGMLTSGVRLITDALGGGTDLPTEAELAAHVTKAGTGMMYDEHANVVVVSMLAGGLVYAGANSAYPHGLPSGYRLRPGDTFMLSLGCAVGGRYVEGERTFVLGEPTGQQRRFHDAVREAQRVGGEAIRPGAQCREANATCLAVLHDAGLGEYLRHRQGHGIGLGFHEPPWLEDGDPTVLAEGMIVSNEPGIYIQDHAGYRISDSMLVTADGSRPLTSYPRGLEDCVIPV